MYKSKHTMPTIKFCTLYNLFIYLHYGYIWVRAGPGFFAHDNIPTNSPTLGSSPTGVLQKSTTFCPLSNSPVAESNNFRYTT
ncbi:BnaA03g54280D [Brassica napus]|uniref:(rape) hypothetical protein n=1 Tax=Brassica napus TaxID=3708 RepID=A0A078GYE0_BRANA|nr:unnamed protein product [Brassica napus]CDY29583.1 BnaA03g54280D [Brassica napus]